VLFLYTCKENNISQSHGSNEETSSMKNHNHTIKSYKGILQGISSGPINTIWGECSFNGEKDVKYYFRNSWTNDKIGNVDTSRFYHIKCTETNRTGFDLPNMIFTLLYNDSLQARHNHMEMKAMAVPLSKGNLGCVPEFIMVNNNLDYFETSSGGTSKRFIQLPLAVHQEGPPEIDTLIFRDFEISVNEYNSLNDLLKLNPFCQGGLDSGPPDTLKIYYANGNYAGFKIPD